jgi:4-amino-4-deoxy-L-arabinose transferase-like glycosyltransferase
MGKKARAKRDRREPAGTVVPAQGARAQPPAVRRQARTPVHIGWPQWPAGGESIDWRLIGVGVAVALIIRVFLLFQVTATPYLEVDNIDAKGYLAWAQQILTAGWLPQRHFYQSPLYAYYLAVVQTVFGDSPWPPRAIQVLLGSASVGLLGVIGTRLFTRRVGLFAMVMFALYGPMILEEVTLSKTSLLVCSALVGFALFLHARDRQSGRGMAAAGLTFGVTIIGVGQWLVALLGLTVFIALDRSTPRRLRRQLAAFFFAGALVVLAPVIAWNSYAGGGLILTSADAGLNLWLGNNAIATALTGRPPGLRDVPEFEEGDSRRLAEREVGQSLTPAQVSSHWTRSAVRWALGNPVAFVGTTRKKITVLWNSFEIPDSYHFAFVREHYLPWLRGSLSFAIVGPLAIIGLVVAVRHRPARALYVIALCYLGVLALFYVRSRYRLPALPFLMVFAAVAIDWIIRTIQRGDLTATAVSGAGLLVAALFVNHTYCEPARADARAICLGGDAWYDLEWQKLAEFHERQGDFETALSYLHRAAQVESIRGPRGLNFWIGRDELQVAERALGKGDSAKASAHLVAAEAAFKRAVQSSYRVAESQTLLATVYRLQGQAEQAVAASDVAVRARPNDPAVLLEALRLHVALKHCDVASRLREDLRRIGAEGTQADQLLAECRT